MYRFYKTFRLYFYCVIHLTLPPVDVRTDLVHKIHGIVIYISHYDFVFILKMVFIAETCCWLCIDFIYILLKIKYFLVSVKHNNMVFYVIFMVGPVAQSV